MKFETGQTSEPTSANISIVSRSSKRGPLIERFSPAFTANAKRQMLLVVKARKLSYSSLFLCFSTCSIGVANRQNIS